MKRTVTDKKDDVRGKVRSAYADIAKSPSGCGCNTGPKSCCGTGVTKADETALALGYSVAELATLPEGANMGLSCGNPVALSKLQPGETVLDLGAGGGFDVFLAAQKVGAKGRAIGVDMTPEMLSKARANAISFSKRTGLKNVEFRLGEIEHLPVADGSVDAIISNCVINLSPDKPQVWREIFRALKPGGRAAVSDLALIRPLPKKIRESVSALVGCVAGAALVEVTEKMMRDAGLVNIRLEMKRDYIDRMSGVKGAGYHEERSLLPADRKLSDYVISLYATAEKPCG